MNTGIEELQNEMRRYSSDTLPEEQTSDDERWKMDKTNRRMDLFIQLIECQDLMSTMGFFDSVDARVGTVWPRRVPIT